MREARTGAGQLLWPVLLLGVAADVLFRVEAVGLNVTLWLGGAVCAWWYCRRRSGATPVGAERALLLGILGLGVAVMWRDNPMLRILNGVALVTSVAILPMVASPTAAAAFWEIPVVRHLNALMHLIRRTLLGLVPTVLDASRTARDERAGMSRTIAAVARGAVLSVPVLLLFGGLLGSADRTFGNFLTGLIRVDLDELTSHVMVVLAAAWLAAAALGGALPDEQHPVRSDAPPASNSLGRVEVGMVLGLVNLLFAAFIAFQLPYFFGGAAWVERTSGITLAEYARTGFFELVAVSAIVLPLLLGLHTRVGPSDGRPGALYRTLATWQLVLVLVIMASAMKRMVIYQSEFGLTEDRFFASAFMAGLAVTFCWFGATVLRGRAERFAGGALVAWAGWLVLLHVVNPERVIVEANLGRAEARHSLDVAYLTGLSSDATPALVDNLRRIPAPMRAVVVTKLHEIADSSAHDWRAWHYGRAKARRLVAGLE